MSNKLIDNLARLQSYLEDQHYGPGAAEKVQAICRLKAGDQVFVRGKVSVLLENEWAGKEVNVAVTVKEIAARPHWQGQRAGYWSLGGFRDLTIDTTAKWTASIICEETHELERVHGDWPSTLWFDFTSVSLTPTADLYPGSLNDVILHGANPR